MRMITSYVHHMDTSSGVPFQGHFKDLVGPSGISSKYLVIDNPSVTQPNAEHRMLPNQIISHTEAQPALVEPKYCPSACPHCPARQDQRMQNPHSHPQQQHDPHSSSPPRRAA